MSERPRVNGITEGVIWKQLLRYFFPIAFGTFFQQMYNTVDAVVVGRYVGKEALAAVGGTTGTLINLLLGFFVGLSGGATVVISQYYGARQAKTVSESVHTAYAFSLAGGLLVSALGVLLLPKGLVLLNTPQEIVEASKTYIRICFAGAPFMLLYNMGSGILRAVGDSRHPLYIQILCCVLNVALDLLLVRAFGMGVAGVALATMISTAVSAALVAAILMRSDDCFRLVLRRIRFHGAILGRIVRIGIPSGLQSMLFTVSNLYIQSSVNSFGTDIIAGWTAIGRVDSLVWMVFDAFGISVTTFAGQNIGAGRMDRVRKAMLQCAAMAAAFSALFTLAIALFGRDIMALFTDEQSVVDAGMKLLNCLYLFYIAYIPITVVSGVLRGAGETLRSMLMIAFGVCAFRAVWIFICRRIGTPVEPMIYSYGASWIATSALFLLYYRFGKWRQRISFLQKDTGEDAV